MPVEYSTSKEWRAVLSVRSWVGDFREFIRGDNKPAETGRRFDAKICAADLRLDVPSVHRALAAGLRANLLLQKRDENGALFLMRGSGNFPAFPRPGAGASGWFAVDALEKHPGEVPEVLFAEMCPGAPASLSLLGHALQPGLDAGFIVRTFRRFYPGASPCLALFGADLVACAGLSLLARRIVGHVDQAGWLIGSLDCFSDGDTGEAAAAQRLQAVAQAERRGALKVRHLPAGSRGCFHYRLVCPDDV